MEVRPLERAEIEKIWTIDRSEVHHHLYQLQEGVLVRIPSYFEIPGWDPDQIEHDEPVLNECFKRGGTFIGMFDDEQLVGVAVVDTVPLGENGDQVQLKYLYVSRDYRGKGVGARLFRASVDIARRRGAKRFYISATPTENTVHFYQKMGAVVTLTPDPELYALEPEDIHLIYPL